MEFKQGIKNFSKSPAFRWTILAVLLIEPLSFFAWLYPQFGNLLFFGILAFVLALSLRDLRYGVAFILADLIVSSHGYLVAFQHEGLAISMRMGIFLVVIATASWKIYQEKSIEIYKSKVFWPLLSLALVVLFSLLWGARTNGFSQAFLDGNGYLFFLLAFPIWQSFKNRNDLWLLIYVGAGALLASILKVLFILYTFSHKFWFMMPETYRWVRDTRVGEITQITEAFWRIFFASQIWAAIAFVVVFVFLLSASKSFKLPDLKKQNFGWLFIFAALLLTTTVISLSRSNWVGLLLAASVLAASFFIFYKRSWKELINSACLTVALFITSGAIITLTVLFPFPPPAGGFSVGNLFSSRLEGFTGGEAAVDSRRGLLPPMLDAIKERPIIGHGFGKTLTYITQDPRIRAHNPTGEYTTYAFEWGYLEIWIKLGLIGLAVYLWFIFSVFVRAAKALWKNRRTDWTFTQKMMLATSLGAVVVITTHAFSPYLNHPLGISYLLFWAMSVDLLKKA